MNRTLSTTLRLGLAGLIGLYALSQAPIALMVWAYRNGRPDLAGASDGAVAGDNFERFVPIMEQMRDWQVAAGFAQIALYLFGALGLAVGWRKAPFVLLTGLAVQIAAMIALRTLPAFSQTWSAAEGAQDYVVLGLVALITAAAFWLTRRPSQAATA
jgi:hypothetical protein